MAPKKETDFDASGSLNFEASIVHTHPRCYFVGPFFKHVSFRSQQTRVQSLLNSIRLSDPFGAKTGERIAIIGAGISGIQTAQLLQEDVETIHIFEAEKNLFSEMRQASHRIVHPSISRWPQLDLDHSTNFNGMNWFAGPASKIADAFIEQQSTQINNNIVSKFYDLPVTAIEYNKQNYNLRFSQSLPHQFNGQQYDTSKNYYDRIFVTTGFGSERDVDRKHTFSYWAPDPTSELTEQDFLNLGQGSVSGPEYHIGGCGDGALLDTFRLIFREFRSGWLPVEVAAAIDDLEYTKAKKIKDRINASETRAWNAARSQYCHAIVDSEPDFPTKVDKRKLTARHRRILATATALGYTEILHNDYRAVVRDIGTLCPALIEYLDSQVAHINKSIIRLVAPEPAPFVFYSAPVHKILLAYAVERGIVQFQQGLIIKKQDRRFLNYWLYSTGQDAIEPVKRPECVVLRHGAPPKLPTLPGDLIAEKALRIKQSLLGDAIGRPRNAHPKNSPIELSELANSAVQCLRTDYRISVVGDQFQIVQSRAKANTKARAEERSNDANNMPEMRFFSEPGELFGIQLTKNPDKSTKVVGIRTAKTLKRK